MRIWTLNCAEKRASFFEGFPFATQTVIKRISEVFEAQIDAHEQRQKKIQKKQEEEHRQLVLQQAQIAIGAAELAKERGLQPTAKAWFAMRGRRPQRERQAMSKYQSLVDTCAIIPIVAEQPKEQQMAPQMSEESAVVVQEPNLAARFVRLAMRVLRSLLD